MLKNWVIKGYDQSVTCLADDPQNLKTRSSMLRTPGILSQTNNSIHKHSSKDAWVNSNKEIYPARSTGELRCAISV